MAAVKVELYKKNGNAVQNYYPKSSADIIDYNGLSVEEVIDAVVDSVDTIENRLQGRSIYMKNSSGDIITDDAGTGLVEIL